MIQSLPNSHSVKTRLVEKLTHHIRKLADFFPALFFFGGFAWDALTIGRYVATSDLFIFAAYLLLAGLILFMISRPSYLLADTVKSIEKLPAYFPAWLKSIVAQVYKRLHYPNLPYFLLQFIFGNLLSALFILYFKSSSHWLAWVMSLMLAVLLVANEYLEDEYKRFTLSWSLFGFCSMLLFNFALPFLIGSIHAVWFYLSTLLGAGFAYWLYAKTPNHFGSIKPVGVIAALLIMAYMADMIPPVPLVKRDIAMAFELNKVNGQYQLSQQAASWWVFWRKTTNDLEIVPGQRVYCFSSVFAPRGLKTRLYHRWQHYDKKSGWQTLSRVGFSLSGGRDGGFRGYTFKQNLPTGDWRVSVETENEKTVAVHEFTVSAVQMPVPQVLQLY
ncbi:MAG: DUF2914 domain-containing protein [Methylotenera sp.]